MPNQRKRGVTRVTLTLPDELLAEIERAADDLAESDPKFDRLDFIREAITEKLQSSGYETKESTKSVFDDGEFDS